MLIHKLSKMLVKKVAKKLAVMLIKRLKEKNSHQRISHWEPSLPGVLLSYVIKTIILMTCKSEYKSTPLH